MKRRHVIQTLAVGALGATEVARAQLFGSSSRTIRIVIGFPPGGVTDSLARIVAPHLERELKATVVVENKPGAGGRIANMTVKGAKPDGTTLLLASSSLMAVYPHVFKNLQYDPLKDFVPVTSVVNMEAAYVASTSAAPNVTTLKDYVQWVKENPANGNYGTVGTGSILHFLGFILARSGGVKLTQIPFNGGAPQMQALNGGQIPFAIDILGGVVPHLESGRVRLLATSGTERSVQGVPTAREAGFDELTFEDYNGFFYPAGTPSQFVQELQAAVKKSLQQESLKESLSKLTLKPSGAETSQFAQRVQSDLEKWRKVVEESGFKQLDS